jgi:hypothetical protein
MARNITVTFADGTSHTYQNAPDDVTPDAVEARASKEFGKQVTALDGGRNSAPKGPNAPNVIDRDTYLQQVQARKEAGPGFFEKGGTAQNVAGGLVRGAGSIGSTLLRFSPIDKVPEAIDEVKKAYNTFNGVSNKSLSDLVTGGKKEPSRDEVRREAMTNGLRLMGVDTDSTVFAVGKIGGEIAGTAGAGGALAQTLGRVPVLANNAAPLLNAIRTSGMTTGATGGNALANLATRAGGGAISGGLQAGMVNPEDAATGAAIGGAFPVVAKAVGATSGAIWNKISNALRSTVSDDVAALARRAKELGVDIPADRLVNNRPMNALASTLNYIPMSGRAATEDAMASQLNKAVSRTFGQDSSNVTMALRKASDKLGSEFDNVLSKNSVKVDKTLLEDLANVYNKAERELGADALKPITKNIDDLMAKGATGEIDGQAAYNIKRELDRLGRGNTTTAFHALELKGKLMDALDRSLGADGAAAFAKTREQYGNMLALEKLAKNGAEGEISAARLGNMQNINNKPLQELADIAAQFVKARESAHGSMQRAVVGTVGGLTAGPVAVAGGAGAGRLANALMNSKSLTGAMTGSPAEKNALMKLLTSQEGQQLMYKLAPALSAAQ